QLFVAEPDIVKPIYMAWDERGRAWVVEARDYPHGLLPESEPGHDSIKICKDTDGDGKADVRKGILPGCGTGDTHAMQSNLGRGFDNWLYGAVGYSNFRGNVGGKELEFGQGVFRFKADGSALEFL